MNKDEANRIIAEFMGFKWESRKIGGVLIKGNNFKPTMGYSESLDALVPVLEKLKIQEGLLLFPCLGQVLIGSYSFTGETIQEAATIATAKAILEINE